MEQAGSTGPTRYYDSIVSAYVRDKALASLVSQTDESLKRDDGRQHLISSLRLLGRAGDICEMLYVEDAILRIDHHHELASKKPYSRYLGNLENAIDSIQMAIKTISLADDPAAYRSSVIQYPKQYIGRDGLPIDAVRKMCSTHPVRLANFMLGMDDIDKDILSHRINNIKSVGKIYKLMQREILGDDWRPGIETAPPEMRI